MDKLTPEESALISYIEEQNPKIVSNLMDEKNRFKQIAQQQIIAQLAEFTPSVNEFLTDRERD